MKYSRLDFGMKLRGFRQQSRYEDISVEELLSVEVVYLGGVYQVVYCCDNILETDPRLEMEQIPRIQNLGPCTNVTCKNSQILTFLGVRQQKPYWNDGTAVTAGGRMAT